MCTSRMLSPSRNYSEIFSGLNEKKKLCKTGRFPKMNLFDVELLNFNNNKSPADLNTLLGYWPGRKKTSAYA